jgi:hypothetical protein
MVRALLDGSKTQTRRIAKVPGIMGGRYPVHPPEELIELEDGEFRRGIFHYASMGALSGSYEVGFAVSDRLYVREEYYQFGHWEAVEGALTKGGRQKWAFVGTSLMVQFDQPTDFLVSRDKAFPGLPRWYKRLGRFMSRSLSRLTLAVTDVRVERLQDCSEADAIGEGIEARGMGSLWGWIDYLEPNPHLTRHFADPRRSYASLWDSINGEGAWDANPWIVAVSFDVRKGNIDG